MDRRIVAGNWKMNLNLQDGLSLARACAQHLADVAVPFVLCPPYIMLPGVRDAVAGAGNAHLGAQDLSAYPNGAHTGEVSAEQLSSSGCSYVIVGHSERRADHAESGELLRAKLARAFAAGLIPIYCFGETLADRDAGNEEGVVAEQLRGGLSELTAEQATAIVLAYEPVWAIGTGRTASPEQAQAMHAFIRNRCNDMFGAKQSREVSILYGGSVKPGNAAELFAKEDIDGALVGGASLRASDFSAIVGACAEA